MSIIFKNLQDEMPNQMSSNCKQINHVPIGCYLPLFPLVTTVRQASLKAHFLSACKKSHGVPASFHLSIKQPKKFQKRNNIFRVLRFVGVFFIVRTQSFLMGRSGQDMNLHSALYVKKKSKVSGVGGRLYTLCWEFYSFKFLKRKGFQSELLFL